MEQKKIEIDTIIDSFLRGNFPSGLLVDYEVKKQYNKSKNIVKNPLKFVKNYTPDCWLIPDVYSNLNVDDYVLNKCNTEEEIERVKMELSLFKEKDLYNLLRLLIFLVDYFRQNDYVWGVGRGSSVSSYVLFLIGIHKIDSIKYNLQIEDFLKD